MAFGAPDTLDECGGVPESEPPREPYTRNEPSGRLNENVRVGDGETLVSRDELRPTSGETCRLMPNRSDSSSNTGLLSRLFPLIPPILLMDSIDFFLGVTFLSKQLSKHSAHEGFP